MALDPRFFCSSDLEGYFVDKDTGLPLAAGIINFYSDVNRTVPKDVYQLSGAPPYNTASFVNLGSTLTLNSVGSYQDGLGNNIVIYYFPFEGSPDDSPFTNIQELYYVEVFSSGNVQQFTREAWPPAATSGGGGDDTLVGDVANYIPNGQFIVYNDPFITTAIGPNDVSPLAQGGWSFRQSTGSTGVYTIDFVSTLGGATNLVDFPPNAVQISRGTLGTETVYELFMQWPDVNTFSKVIDGDNPQRSFNLLSAIKSNDGFAETLNVYVVQNFGGADTDHYTAMSNISVSADNNFNYYNTTIDFPDNSGTPILGSGSYVGIAIRMPATAFDLLFTDFALTITNAALSSYPTTSPAQALSRSINGYFPFPDVTGRDLYLPLVLTPQGMTWDHSIVGKIEAKPQLVANPLFNELKMDGSSYISTAYSALGIPYGRLAQFLTTNAAAVSVTNGTTTSTLPATFIPMFGTGPNFVSIFKNVAAGKFDLSFNTASGGNAVNDQTSGFTHTSADPLYVFTVPGVPTAGQYFSFTTGVDAKVYNVWFIVDGAGTAPATPSGANIPVPIASTISLDDLCLIIASAVNSYQFYLPNLSGYFLRGLDTTATVDPDAASRTVPGVKDNANAWTGAHLGSIQGDVFKTHTHAASAGSFFLSAAGGLSLPAAGANAATAAATAATGGSETRPVNFAVNFFIRY